MKIKTITCHDCYNFGASLQAYALQTHLASLGHEVEIINYKPDYLSGHFNMWAVSNPVFNKPLIKQLYLLAKLPGRLRSLSRKKVFDEFTAKYLYLTRRYNSYEELKADAPAVDVYIAGSDQIWNTLFRNGRDAAFYLDFGKPEVKRISYAASFSTPDVAPEYREFVRHELKNFDHISIREKTSLPLLKSLGRPDGVAVCDPVFLLSREHWEDMINQSSHVIPKEKYILLYLSDRGKNIETIAKKIREITGWKIYAVGAITASYADKNFTNASPLNFLTLIRNAQIVVSNSFHATAFSLIMHTKFCVVNRIEGINERMKSMLEDFGIAERLISNYSETILDEIDWSKLNSIKENITDYSKKWLSQLL